MRVFEDNRFPMENPRRFRVEILFSPGANATPFHLGSNDRETDASRFDTAGLEMIGREGLTCAEVESFFEEVILAGRSEEDDEFFEVTSTPTMVSGNVSTSAKGEVAAETVTMPSETKLEANEMPPVLEEKTIGDLPTTKERSELPVPSELDQAGALVDNPKATITERATGFDFSTERGTTDGTVAESQAALPSSAMSSDGDRQGETDTDAPTSKIVPANRSMRVPDDDSLPDSRKSDDSLPVSNGVVVRKVFWSAVSIGSIALGMTCLYVAMTLGERRPRRWATRK